MLYTYCKLALRNLAKHRLYALINITGLALGLAVFLLSSILVAYECNHDHMFSKRDHIYLVASIFAPTSGETIRELTSVQTVYGPLFEQEIKDAQYVSRSLLRKKLLTIDKASNYVGIRFVDKGFTRIFDFHYLYGDMTAVDDPHGLIITTSTAKRLFGRTNVLNNLVTLDRDYPMHIAAVIEDIAADSHFNSSFLPDSELTAIAPAEALTHIDNFKMAGAWTDFSMDDATYIMLSKNRDQAWLQDQVNAVSTRHASDDERRYISSLKVIPLIEVNTEVWSAFGLPVIETVRLLGLLVLIIACVNYTNLATAQNFGRTREVGLRRTFGAQRRQLVMQFLLESLCIALFAMLLALAMVEILLPIYNAWAGRVVKLDYAMVLPRSLLLTIVIGLLAGAYPAYVSSRPQPIDSLRNSMPVGHKAGSMRGLMITAQFSISIFMLAMVMVIYFQNEKLREAGKVFPVSRIVTLEELDAKAISEKRDLLRQQLLAVPGVEAVTYSGRVPFEQSNITRKVTPDKADQSRGFEINMMFVDVDFLKVYGIKLLAGRAFDPTITDDVFKDDVEHVNVVVNQRAAEKLGFGRGTDVVGKTFYKIPETRFPKPRQYTIIGLIPDMHFNLLFNEMKPMMLYIRRDHHRYASILLSDEHRQQTLDNIDAAWRRVIVDYPIQKKMLAELFKTVFGIFHMMNNVVAIFAAIAILLSLIGLFGLTAFMAQGRIKEIGLRKIMGASVNQIVRLLIWQFSTPVLWSLMVATPLAYQASNIYLNTFGERIGFVIPVIMFASVLGMFAAWLVVAFHALSIAKATPIQTLRYE